MKIPEEKEVVMSIQLGPMIDCVMMLLMYFIAAGHIRPEEKYLGLMIPGGAGKAESLPQELTLAIAETGQVFCNNTPVDTPVDKDLPMMRAKIKQCLGLFGDKQPVVIHPQPKVRHQRITDVLNACGAAGVKNLSFYANQ